MVGLCVYGVEMSVCACYRLTSALPKAVSLCLVINVHKSEIKVNRDNSETHHLRLML